MTLKAKKGYKFVKGLFGKYEEIPEEWEIKKIDEIGKLSGGGTPDTTNKEYWNGKILWAVPTDITKLQANLIGDTERKITKYGLENSSANLLPSGAILITSRATIGKCVITTKPITTNQGFQSIICGNEYNNLFIFYLIKYNRNILLRLSYGTTFLEISKKEMSKISIPVPNSTPEQQKIAEMLSNIDELINSTQKIIDQTKSLKKGLMQKLLTKGIGHKQFKKVNFGRHFISYEIPEEWELSRLGNHSTVHGRIGWKNLRSDEYLESGFPMLSVWSLVETSPYGIDFTKGIKRLSQFRYDESPEIQLQNNDILIAKDGDIGRIGFIKNLPEPATVNSHVVPVRVIDELINPEFLYWFFKSKPFQTYCKSFTSGTTIPLFTQKDLRNCIIPIPKKEEQNKIVTILSNIDSRIISQIQYKEKLERLKKSLMQKLLTGEVRVIV